MPTTTKLTTEAIREFQETAQSAVCEFGGARSRTRTRPTYSTNSP